jgi:NAD(P)-dependent dehydrogenase (short-subunit alcohol dehydrogenase family)
MDFSGRTVVITGAAGNLGGAVAAAFARRNADLVLVDRRVERLATRFGPESARQRFAAADLTSASETAAIATQAMQWFGRIDVLCNIAGGFRSGVPVHESSGASTCFAISRAAFARASPCTRRPTR